MKAKLQYTEDYNLFELHPNNRPLSHTDMLEESMKKNGFMPSSPIQCVPNGNGKLKIIRGHHRFACAKKLKLGVYYVVDNSVTDLFSLEGPYRQKWTLSDFANARAKGGNPACRRVIAFQTEHGLTLGTTIALLGGKYGEHKEHSCNDEVKEGTYCVTDEDFANHVANTVAECKKAGLPFATNSLFVGALARSLKVPKFDSGLFIQRLRTSPGLMKRRSNINDYLQEIENLYNRNAKANRLPLVFEANKIARSR